MIPTLEEYNKAKLITTAYETEQARLFDIKLEALKKDLTEYFANNTIDGEYITEFKLRRFYNTNQYEIIPHKPYIDESYSGNNDMAIEELCKKHNIIASFVAWMYPK